jgi:3-oxo-5-alpha-steroid 4-dehydrogenase 1
MTADPIYNTLLIVWIALSLVIFIMLFFITAPYGRHIKSGWGPSLNSKLGWVLMEAWSPLIIALCFLLGSVPITIASVCFLLLWEAHYIHRAFIYPFSLTSARSNMPLSVVLSGIFFNFINASLNGYYVFTLSGGYSDRWLTDPRFIMGVLLFIAGFIINRQSDYILGHLRKPGDKEYKIPYGGLYNWIACPNYFGEILIWSGWALATWSLAGLSFALWTIANLAPRARSHQDWYHKTFPNYPANRKTLLPGIW